jgi:serine acetyltransferase
MSGWSSGFFSGLRNVLSGLRLLANPTFVRALGDHAAELTALEQLRHANPSCRIDNDIVFHAEPIRTLVLGQGVRVSRGTVFGSQPLPEERPLVTIGDNTYLGEYTNIRTAPGTTVSIGADVLIAQFCSIVSANHRTDETASITTQGIDLRRHSVVIEDGVWLGAGTTVLPGVTIGMGAVVGANSVVNRNIPPHEIWAGCPARKLGTRGQSK